MKLKLKNFPWFWVFYAFLAILFFLKPLYIGWDSAEFLAVGKYIFGNAGYVTWFRPPVWPIILGFFWKLGFPMPVTMQFLSIAFYFSIPLITYFSFKDSRKYIGLIIAINLIFFKYSHAPLSHIAATFFLLLAFSTKGFFSGVFSALSGLSRFTFLIGIPMSWLYGDFKSKIKGQVLVLLPYFLFVLFKFGNPLQTLESALSIINNTSFLWFLERGPLFYLGLISLVSPFLFLALLSKKPSRLAFIVVLVYFSLLSHKEDRFLADILVYGVIAFCEKFDKLPILVAGVQILFLPFSFVNLYSAPPEIFSGIRDGSVVFGMEPSVNAYKDVEFLPWFSSEEPMRFDSADYCIYRKEGIACRYDDEQCNSAASYFEQVCRSWNILAEKDGFVVAEKPPS